jgi:DNA-binding GntR family transcriptional regulator
MLREAHSLRDQVFERVRTDIVSGHSAPGAMYSVPTLANELGTSTTPVREALLALANDGLISPVRNRGFRVEEMSVEALRDLFALRVLVEGYAMEQLAERRITDTEELRKLADAVGVAVKAKDNLAYTKTDRAFHSALVAQAKNPRLTRMVMELRDGMRLYGMDTPAGRQRQIASVKEHYQLIDHAVAGDKRAISALIKQHIQSWEPVFTQGVLDRMSAATGSSRRH